MSFYLRKKVIPLAVLSLSVLIVMMCISVVNANADTTKKESLNEKKVETFIPDDPEKFIKEQGWEKPTPDAKLVKVTRVTEEPDDKIDGIKEEENIKEPFLFYSIKNVRNIGQLCGSTVQARTSGTGGADGVLTLKQTASVSNSYNANVGVSASKVSAEVGFDVTETMSRTTSYKVNTRGKNYQIVAYDDFQGKSFDVYNLLNNKVGSGTALRQVGFCYAAYEI